MRTWIGLAALFLAVVIDGQTGAQAQERWCAWYDAYTYNCGFRTFRQCQATVAGIGGFCRRNTWVERRYIEPRYHRRSRSRLYDDD